MIKTSNSDFLHAYTVVTQNNVQPNILYVNVTCYQSSQDLRAREISEGGDGDTEELGVMLSEIEAKRNGLVKDREKLGAIKQKIGVVQRTAHNM